MKNVHEHLELFQRFMDMLEQQFGASCEISLHDFTSGYEHSIIDIRNKHVTGRDIGGCGTNLGLEIMNGTKASNQSDRYNYITYAKNGKILRSSSIHFLDPDGKLIGAFCVNLDISDTIKFENYLKEYNHYDPNDADNPKEFFVENVQQLLDELVRQGMHTIMKPVSDMDKDDKVTLINYLDARGAFNITKASEVVCDLLSISKNTFYNYLDIARNNRT